MKQRTLSLMMLFLAGVFGLLACISSVGNSVNGVAANGWWAERGPVVPHQNFPADCALCHEGTDWQTIKTEFEFDHLAVTGVELKGAHDRAECLRCHNDRGPVATFAERGCSGCHEDIHQGQLGASCDTCHDENSWEPSEEVLLHNRTRFPLVARHAAVACWACHEGARSGNFSNEDTECIACHRDDLARATVPDHTGAGFSESCDRCHTPTSWSGAGFHHTGFPLTGAHRSINCEACHVGGIFSALPSDCYSCHTSEYVAAPEHVSGDFPTNCEFCHSTSSWSGAAFTHQGITQNCASCHLDDYNQTTSPNHAQSSFPTTCESCHFNTNTWQGAEFDHRPFFPLRGPHRLDCSSCHTTPGNFSTFECITCHEHRKSKMDSEHNGVNNYVWSSPACLNCHPDGDD